MGLHAIALAVDVTSYSWHRRSQHPWISVPVAPRVITRRRPRESRTLQSYPFNPLFRPLATKRMLRSAKQLNVNQKSFIAMPSTTNAPLRPPHWGRKLSGIRFSFRCTLSNFILKYVNSPTIPLPNCLQIGSSHPNWLLMTKLYISMTIEWELIEKWDIASSSDKF